MLSPEGPPDPPPCARTERDAAGRRGCTLVEGDALFSSPGEVLLPQR